MTSEDLGYLSANKKKTVKEIRDEGKRPHISIIDSIIKKNDLKPTLIFDINALKIIA